jgi:hypothetical protein
MKTIIGGIIAAALMCSATTVIAQVLSGCWLTDSSGVAYPACCAPAIQSCPPHVFEWSNWARTDRHSCTSYSGGVFWSVQAVPIGGLVLQHSAVSTCHYTGCTIYDIDTTAHSLGPEDINQNSMVPIGPLCGGG